MQGRCVWTDERGDDGVQRVERRVGRQREPYRGHVRGRNGPLRGRDRRLHFSVAVRGRCRRRRGERARRRPQGPGAVGSAAPLRPRRQEGLADECSSRRLPQAGQTSLRIRPGAGHLVRAGPGRADQRGLAPVRRVCGRDLLGHRQRLSAADRVAARRGGRRADRHGRPGQGVRRFRELERAAGRGRVPGGECGGEVRTRTPHQPARGERVRTLHARIGIQHLFHRCPDRAGVSEQYGARRRALPDHSFTRPERRLHAGRSGKSPPGRLSHVLRHGEPERLVGPVAHGHLRQPDRRLAGGASPA